MMGNLLALFLVEVIGDALEAIPADPADQIFTLNDLIAQENADHQRLLDSDVPPLSEEWDTPDPDKREIRRLFYKERNMCHLALLPAQIRYKGILTESTPTSVFDLENDKGLLLSNKVRKQPNEGDELRLVGDIETRQKCEVTLNVDHQDYFYIDGSEGWKGLTLPNTAEMGEYRSDREPFRGLIYVCYVGCPWNDCPEHNIVGGVAEKTVEMEVNGIPVTSMYHVFKECHVLQHSGGNFFKANDDGRFNIRVRITEKRSYTRFSSIIIW